MKPEDFEELVDKGFNLVEATKMGYAEIRGKDGKTYWITEKQPLNPAMVTDLYEFTMMADYIESGRADEIGTFQGFYRKNPFEGGFGLTAGLNEVLDYLEQLQFTGRDIDHMRKQWKMPESLYEYLREAEFNGTVEALPEGTMSQPHIPIIQVTGPLPIANFVETHILNQIGYPTMVITKAARIALQGSEPYLEFGLRRAPSIDAANKASRAAYIGGAAGTSNVAAELIYGIPARGTMAHSLVMAFPTQREAFRSYADIFREESVFLIDTYGYESGVRDAIAVAKELGLKTFKGVRDDSGDLAYQSKIIRRILDENGFQNAQIMVSNEIDEYVRRSLREQGAERDMDGIGEKLVTPPSSGLVYKLVQIGDRPVIKVSRSGKTTDPGRKKLCRFVENGYYAGDVMLMYDEELGDEITAIRRSSDYETKRFSGEVIYPLVTVFENGKRIYQTPHIDDIKQNVLHELSMMWPEIQRLENPAKYFIWLSPELNRIKKELIKEHPIRR